MVQGRKIKNYGPNEILDFNTSFERSLSKLSENHNIFDIGSTIPAPPLRLINGSLNSVDPISTDSESLEETFPTIQVYV